MPGLDIEYDLLMPLLAQFGGKLDAKIHQHCDEADPGMTAPHFLTAISVMTFAMYHMIDLLYETIERSGVSSDLQRQMRQRYDALKRLMFETSDQSMHDVEALLMDLVTSTPEDELDRIIAKARACE